MPQFLAIGECMVELSEAGPGLVRKGFAGDTFNVSWYARKLLPPTWRVSYLSAVGDDPLSGEMLAFMQASGIETAPVRRLRGGTPGLYLIGTSKGERSFTYWRDSSAARRLADDLAHLRHHLATADAVHFSAITLAIIPPQAADHLLALLRAARERGAVVAFDTNYRPALWRGRSDVQTLLLAAARSSSVVLPGLDDEQAVFGPCNAGEAASRYRAAGADVVAVKDGARGSDVYWSGGHAHVPAGKPRAIVDTSAAGDSFAAGFLSRHVQGDDPVAAAQCGAAVAAEVVAVAGALVPLSAGLTGSA